MTARIFIGERETAGIDPANRGLAYGDGVFETMRVHGGGVPLWPRHLARLQEGALRLGIPVPDVAFIEASVAGMLAGCNAGVLKLLVTRGDGARGYAPEPKALPAWTLALHPLPASLHGGLRLHWCETRLAVQPALAGIKHCNRLEQVLARTECVRQGCDEGLMRDTSGNVVCATGANLLVLHQGTWTTPPVADCGVAGVMRQWLLDEGMIHLSQMSSAQVEAADALALCNAVRGILTVANIGALTWQPHPAVARLRASLVEAYPMFSLPMGVDSTEVS